MVHIVNMCVMYIMYMYIYAKSISEKNSILNAVSTLKTYKIHVSFIMVNHFLSTLFY